MSAVTLQPPPAARLQATFQRLTRMAGLFALTVGALVLLGWAAHIPILKTAVSGGFAMKANAAVALTLLGAGLRLVAPLHASARSRLVGRGLVALTALIALVTLAEYAGLLHDGIDEALFREPPGTPGTGSPGRMSINAAFGFASCSVGLLILDVRPRVAAALGLLAMLDAVLALTGYAYDAKQLLGFAAHTRMALNAAIALGVAATGTVLAAVVRGALPVLAAPTPGGVAVRWLLPGILVVPLGLGWLELQAQRSQWLSTEVSDALFATAEIVLLMLLAWWAGVSLDRAARDHEAMEAARRKSERDYNRIIATIQDGIAAYDTERRIVFLNSKMASMLGYSTEEMLGHSIFDFLDAAARREMLAAVERREASQAETYELQAKHRDGSPVWLLVAATPVLDEGGQVAEVFVIATDITGRKKAELELQESARDLARSNAELEQFAYVASHDLQEPLRMVTSYLQLLSRRYQGKLDADADEFIGFAVDGAKRMQALIQDLLAYSRVGRRGREFQPVDCNSLMEQVQKGLRQAIEASGGKVTHDVLPTVLGDEVQLGQVLQNLVSNGLKFQRKGVAPEVHVAASRVENGWCFDVRDNGIGIQPEYFDRIFILFQRLHGIGEFEGTGIGLAICKKIVERHGGRIWVESEPGHGSTFRFTVPDPTPPRKLPA